MPEYEMKTDIFGDPVPEGTKQQTDDDGWTPLGRIAMSLNDPKCEYPGCNALAVESYIGEQDDVASLCRAHYAGWAAGDRGERTK